LSDALATSSTVPAAAPVRSTARATSGSSTTSAGSTPGSDPTQDVQPVPLSVPPLGIEITQDRRSYLAALHQLLEDARLTGRAADTRHYMSLIGRVAGFTDEVEPEPPSDADADRELALRLARKVGLTPEDLK
jgi:hypothetical protein